MRAWIRVLDAPGCYDRRAWVERKSTLQGSGLVRTVGPFAHSRVPQVIATARDVLSNDWRESTWFKRPAKQALALATEPRAKREARSILIIPIIRPVSTFEQSENVAIAHIHLVAMRGVPGSCA